MPPRSLRPDGGEQRRLVALLARQPDARDAEIAQIGLDIGPNQGRGWKRELSVSKATRRPRISINRPRGSQAPSHRHRDFISTTFSFRRRQ